MSNNEVAAEVDKPEESIGSQNIDEHQTTAKDASVNKKAKMASQKNTVCKSELNRAGARTSSRERQPPTLLKAPNFKLPSTNKRARKKTAKPKATRIAKETKIKATKSKQVKKAKSTAGGKKRRQPASSQSAAEVA